MKHEHSAEKADAAIEAIPKDVIYAKKKKNIKLS